jgi:acylphosphatase
VATSEGQPVKRLQAVVTGRVQGVGFRDFVRRQAVRRNLTGFVRNGAGGRTVEVIAEGEEAALRELVDRLRTGPRFSAVDRVDAAFVEAAGAFTQFTVAD